jgi:hypothetical protein
METQKGTLTQKVSPFELGVKRRVNSNGKTVAVSGDVSASAARSCRGVRQGF